MGIRGELSKLWRIATDAEYRAVRAPFRQFRRERGRETPATFDHLSPGDVALDVGGYEGDWAQMMTERYGVTVHVFEPHPVYAAAMATRFAERGDVHVHDFAIGSADGTLELSDQANASSALVSEGPTVTGRVRAVADVVAELKLGEIGAVKMNIEGGEYDLLPAMMDAELMARVDRLVVQFHRYTPAQAAERDAIRARLGVTHVCEWDYPFVWEQWARKV